MATGDDLLAIYAEAAQYARDERDHPPEACPYDGEPLQQGTRGALFCKLGDYRWPRDGRVL